jgi:hypothetical protein
MKKLFKAKKGAFSLGDLPDVALTFVLIGVFREIFTIPFLIAQLLFLVLGIIHIIKYKTHLFTFISIVLLAINAIYIAASFF